MLNSISGWSLPESEDSEVCVPRDPRGGNSSSILAEWICSSCQENFCKVKISVILLCYGSGILYYK